MNPRVLHPVGQGIVHLFSLKIRKLLQGKQRPFGQRLIHYLAQQLARIVRIFPELGFG
ncbi:hypothetical protein D3C73_1158820 [compost metagenome]